MTSVSVKETRVQLKQPAPLQCGDTRSVLHAGEQGGATPRLSSPLGPGTEARRQRVQTAAAFPERRILQEPSSSTRHGKDGVFSHQEGKQERHQRLAPSFLESPKGGTTMSQWRDWGEWHWVTKTSLHGGHFPKPLRGPCGEQDRGFGGAVITERLKPPRTKEQCSQGMAGPPVPEDLGD